MAPQCITSCLHEHCPLTPLCFKLPVFGLFPLYTLSHRTAFSTRTNPPSWPVMNVAIAFLIDSLSPCFSLFYFGRLSLVHSETNACVVVQHAFVKGGKMRMRLKCIELKAQTWSNIPSF